MSYHINNFIIKQTALLLLCGLLPCVCPAQQRGFSEAAKIANRFVEKKAFKDIKHSITMKFSSSVISSDANIRKDKEAYYVFAAEKEEPGFIIVSGDERMPEVLAYSENNNFRTDNMPANVRYWLDCYEEVFLSLDENVNHLNSPLEYSYADSVAPLLGNNVWGQGNPYNSLCPSVKRDKCVTGCVATAMAQVMKYHEYPDRGRGQINYSTSTNNIHLQKDFSAVQFSWDKMLDDYAKDYTQEQANAVAELMFACGASVRMDYCTEDQGGSGAYQTDLIPAFVDNFFYDNDAAFMDRRHCSIEDWHQLLLKELNAGHPVNYAGQSSRDGGHSFVLDGYKMSAESNYPYYHVNWGWNGDCDGYYLIADLHPSVDGQHATFEGFNDSQQMTIGIQPEDGINEDIYYLCTPNLYVSQSAAKAGSSLRVYTSSCVNYSYKSFAGEISVVLVSEEDGSETVLGKENIKELDYLEVQNNLSIDISLPSTLTDGQYQVKLLSKQYGKNDYQKVLSKKYPLLTISSSDVIAPEENMEAMLGSSELEVINSSDSSLVILNIYELQNLQNTPFIGDLKIMLADTSGRQLCSFGDSIQPGELSTFEVQNDPLKIQGALVGDWPDGNYKLYVGARQLNTTKFVYISFYDVMQPDKAYQDLSLNAVIKDGKLIVNGITYTIIPTSINHVEIDSLEDNPQLTKYYYLDGRSIDVEDIRELSPNIYIMRRGNNTRKFVVR